jgi:hypothetical protein
MQILNRYSQQRNKLMTPAAVCNWRRSTAAAGGVELELDLEWRNAAAVGGTAARRWGLGSVGRWRRRLVSTVQAMETWRVEI